jgi:hypothetical protein
MTTLWRLAWNDDQLSCVVYRGDDGLQLRLESKKAVILSQPFEMRPRALARLKTLRESLKRRGWRESEKPRI